jgi:acyl-CoA synthetase (NDP forming)
MAEKRDDLLPFFAPRGVALVGQVDRALSEERSRALHDARYGAGNWHLVNPKGGRIGSIPIHRALAQVPGPLELAVISAPARLCARVVEECGARGVRSAIVFSSGFSEVGGEGARLERELARAARRAGVRLLGPNTNTNVLERIPEVPNLRGGRIGVVTQSGHNGRPIVQGVQFGIGFTRQVPCGNEADLEVADFIEYFAGDDETAVIAGYVEGFRTPEKLRRALEAANRSGKPVVLLKAGSTRAGARMASSHTGHLAGSDAVVEGLFRQYGVVRVRDLDELLETAALFAKLPPGAGARAALYSISGGSGTLMAEMAELAGIEIPRLAAPTQARLRELLPRDLTVANPVDNGGAFLTTRPPEVRREVIDVIAADPRVDLVVVGVTGALPPMTDELGADLEALAERGCAKPLVVTWNSFQVDSPGFQAIVRSGLPLFRSFRNAFGALRAWADHRRARPRFRPRPPLRAALPAAARRVLEAAPVGEPLAAGEARALLAAVGIPLVAEVQARSGAEAERAVRRIGPPVALKLDSPDLPHKSDAGLVRLGVAAPAAARRIYGELHAAARRARRRARIAGVSVQAMVADGVEAIVGVTRDPCLGPAVLVGMGGVFAEVLSDVAVCPLPLDAGDAREMVRSLRGYPLLRGARGRPRADEGALVRTILRVARMATALGPRLRELDLNPVLVRPRGALVVDQLVVLGARE